MDFFGAQDDARRKSRRLYLLFGLTVTALIATLYLTAAVVTGQAWNPLLLAGISGITLFLIAAGALYKMSQLGQGGAKVARLLGGRLIGPDTAEASEQRLLNIVEEMAIASGIPVPPVYVMDNEKSINAFAAGLSTRDAVVGVTRGCLEQLSRDELQGVIAHEFSHIFNGDMRISIRLIGLLNGIMLIHLAGMILIRFNMYSRGGSKEAAQAKLAFMAFGLLMVVLGYAGVIFGQIIQAAVSRQREYLADASAVQYTRNPEGLAGALRKIQKLGAGQKMKDANATEMGHLFFSRSTAALFSTHPPLHKRIKALKAAWMLDEAAAVSSAAAKPGTESGTEKKEKKEPAFGGMSPEMLIAAAGNMQHTDAEHVRRFLQGLPQPVRNAMRHYRGGVDLSCALLLSGSDEVREKQLTAIEEIRLPDPDFPEGRHITPLPERVLQLYDIVRESVEPAHYLLLAELSLPALRSMKPETFAAFKSLLNRLTEADGRISIFELCLELVITHHLEAHFAKNSKARKTGAAGYQHSDAPKRFFISLSVLLSAVSHAAGGKAEAAQAWAAGHRALEQQFPQSLRSSGFKLDFMAAERCTPSAIKNALDDFSSSGPALHKQFLLAAARAATVDQEVTLRESRLLHALAASLDVPLPFSVLLRFSA